MGYSSEPSSLVAGPVWVVGLLETKRALHLTGVRVHNLQGIAVDVRLGRLTVLTGVSGAGKSSLAIDTIHAESQRRFFQTLPIHARRYSAGMAKPDADQIDHLPPTRWIRWDRDRSDARQTFGLFTDIHDRLALLYARHGNRACEKCGAAFDQTTVSGVAARVEALPAGTRYQIAFPFRVPAEVDEASVRARFMRRGFRRVHFGDRTIELDASEDPLPRDRELNVVVDRLSRGAAAESRLRDSLEAAFTEGRGRLRVILAEDVRPYTRVEMCAACGNNLEPLHPNAFKHTSPQGACLVCGGRGFTTAPGSNERLACASCGGARLRPESLAVTVAGCDIATQCAKSVSDVRASFAEFGSANAGGVIVESLVSSLSALERLGLGDCPLNRPLDQLSSGELVRSSLASAIGSGLVEVLYVLDEPSRGQHEEDIDTLLGCLKTLRDQGNTVLVVDSRERLVQSADFVIELGPGGGPKGGRVVFAGEPGDLAASGVSPASDCLRGSLHAGFRSERRAPRGMLKLKGASAKNLQSIDVEIPLGVLCLIAGVTASGKSALARDCLYAGVEAALSEESARQPPNLKGLHGADAIGGVHWLGAARMRGSRRSCPATVSTVFAEIRKAFAETHEATVRNLDASHFALNHPGGRCEACQGTGTTTIDLHFLGDVVAPCADCEGRRYRPETLEVLYRGKSIADVLDLSVREAFAYFRTRARIQRRLRPMLDLGLDYLRLGQSIATLSSGESKRLELAMLLSTLGSGRAQMATGRGSLFVVDQPSAGLHPAELHRSLDVFGGLVNLGHGVVLVENHPLLLMAADWIIELGPGGGGAGGTIVAADHPEALALRDTPTGRVLASALRKREIAAEPPQ